MKAKVSGGGRVRRRVPAKVMSKMPSPLPSEGNGGGRVTDSLPAKVISVMPSPLPSNSGGRGKANEQAPAKAKGGLPSPARRSTKSGKRGKASRPSPAKATPCLPSSASPDLKARRGGQPVSASSGQLHGASPPAPNGGGGHMERARKGQTEDASPSTPNSEGSGQRRIARKGLPAGASPPAPSNGKGGHGIIASNGRGVRAAPPVSIPPKRGKGGQANDAKNGQQHLAAPPALSPTIDRVFLLYEQRRDLLSTASGMTNRLKALTKIRRGLPVSAKVSEAMILETPYPPIDTLLSARGVLRDHLGKIEKELEQFAEDLPAYASFWKPQRGLSGLGLALIAGEAGDLAGYSTHSKLWRRFGLHVDGVGRAYWKRRPGLSAEDWEMAGYCPRRRSIIFQLTDSLLKAQIRKDEHDPDKRVALGEYGALYLREKARQQEKAKAEGLTVCPAAKIPAKAASKYRSEGHIHNRAARYVGKKLLRDLWKVWRREASHTEPKGHADVASRSPSKSAGRVILPVPARASVSLPSPPSSPAT